MTQKDAFNSYFRQVHEFTIDHTENIGNIQMVRFYIRGQSFGYNMIKKMIAAVSEVACMGGSMEVLEQTFDKKVKRQTNNAPSQGIILYKANFKSEY